MEKTEELVFGLDIGTRSIVGTVGYKKSTNDFTVVAQAVKLHDTRAMMDGQIHDINKVADTIAQVKNSLEEQIGQRLKDVCIAAAGRVLKTVTVHAKTEFPQEVSVTPELIRALEVVGVENAHQQIRAEAGDDKTNYYCVAYTVMKYYLNDFSITNLEGHRAKKIAADVLVTFLPDEVIGSLYVAVEKAGLWVSNLTLEPIAAIQVAIPEKFRLLNIALIDVGAGTSDISITKDGSIIAYGMIPMAGDALTEYIAGRHLVDFDVAEKIKLESQTKKKSISYKDIMGLPKKTTPAEIREELRPAVYDMTKKVADKIIELNGGKPVSAVFVVGGGGKITGYTECLAEHLDIPKERVAIRGEEVLGFVEFLQEDIKKDPTLVTPIGICLNYYNNTNNFVFVKVNGESVKLYDNNKLTVIDAALQMGFPNECMFPRRGKPLNFFVDGAERVIRGAAGEAAEITVNGQPAAFNSPIAENDEITIKESTIGKDASCEVRQLPEYRNKLNITINNTSVACPKLAEVNGTPVSEFYSIAEGDKVIFLSHYTLETLLEFTDMPYREDICVNGEPAELNTKLYEGDAVTWEMEVKISIPDPVVEIPEPVAEEPRAELTEEPVHAPAETQAEEPEEEPEEIKPVVTTPPEIPGLSASSTAKPVQQGTDCYITVNGKVVILKGKKQYVFVDILDFYPFDVSKAYGQTVVLQINGNKAEFSSPIKDSDIIDLYWK